MAAIDQKVLERGWLHAHEEDRPGQEVFRPDTRPLPPSRGRRGYEFLPDGKVVKRAPGPTDRRTATQGTWAMDQTGHLTIRIPGQPDEVLQLESVEPDRLIVKKQ